MLSFDLRIHVGNDEMSHPAHVARALEQVAESLHRAPAWGPRVNQRAPIQDANGNSVGSYAITEVP